MPTVDVQLSRFSRQLWYDASSWLLAKEMRRRGIRRDGAGNYPLEAHFDRLRLGARVTQILTHLPRSSDSSVQS